MAAPRLSWSVGSRLSIMMFLQFAIWGAWLPLMWAFLREHREFTEVQTGTIMGLGAIGALLAPFIAGQIADRYFNTERFLGISHIVGAVLVWQLAAIESYTGLIVFAIAYSVIYAPTLALTNSLAFHHLPDRDRDFGMVRLWGTIGWIAVGIGLGQWLYHRHTPGEAELKPQVHKIIAQLSSGELWQRDEATRALKLERPEEAESPEGTMERLEKAATEDEMTLEAWTAKRLRRLSQVKGMGDAFRASAVLGFILGIFCFFLPKTPPQPGRQKFAPLEAIGELKSRTLLVLFLLSLPIACVHQFYFTQTSGLLGKLNLQAPLIDNVFGVGGGGLMTIGQMSEIFVLALMPLVAVRASRKAILTVGLLAYILRFAIFGFSDQPALIIPALGLHGLVFGCFFFVAFMIIDEETSPNVRASAQGLYALLLFGLGPIIAGPMTALIEGRSKTAAGGIDYSIHFGIPMAISVVCLLGLLVFYPGGKRKASSEPGS